MVEIKQKPQLHASWIDRNAKEIVQVLQKDGFKTFLVGGCVRDLLVGHHPKDYDIATDAEPNQVKRKVWGSYVIGKRFRLVLVKRGTTQYEVATFRRAATADDFENSEIPATTAEHEPPTPRMTDNFFGTPEQDALRRDFTINALFYDPINDELIDYADGLRDIESRTMRMIGDPIERIIEDPIRSLRAIRLSHKLKFSMDESLRKAIQTTAPELSKSVLPRRREEYLKFLRLPDAIPAWTELYDLGIIDNILPTLKPVFEDPEKRDIFLSYLQQMDLWCLDDTQAAELFLPLIIGFIRAMRDEPDFEEQLSRLMKDELMMFKTENAAVLGALDFIQNLDEIEYYKRKGFRRQEAFLRSEFFPIALRIAERDFLLPQSQIQFWKEQIQKHFSNPREKNQSAPA